jgi:mono/diheme cytochrome c family protein
MLYPAKSETSPTMKRLVAVCVAIGSILLPPSIAAGQDFTRGRDLAVRWCSGCHVVDRSPATASADGVPTFPAIAAKGDVSTDHLRAAMNPTHGRMPDLALAKRDQDDLAAYILSLRRN